MIYKFKRGTSQERLFFEALINKGIYRNAEPLLSRNSASPFYPSTSDSYRKAVRVVRHYDLKLRSNTYKTKKPQRLLFEALINNWHLPTLPGLIQVPSAVRGLTALFEMGRGVHPPY